MKVIVRSSSLLFTLLSIILQAPIRRVPRRVIDIEAAAAAAAARGAQGDRYQPSREQAFFAAGRRLP